MGWLRAPGHSTPWGSSDSASPPLGAQHMFPAPSTSGRSCPLHICPANSPRVWGPWQPGSWGSSPGWSSILHPRCPQRESTFDHFHLLRAGTLAQAVEKDRAWGFYDSSMSSRQRQPVSGGSSPAQRAALGREMWASLPAQPSHLGNPQGGRPCSFPPGPAGCADQPWRRQGDSESCHPCRQRDQRASGRHGSCPGKL